MSSARTELAPIRLFEVWYGLISVVSLWGAASLSLRIGAATSKLPNTAPNLSDVFKLNIITSLAVVAASYVAVMVIVTANLPSRLEIVAALLASPIALATCRTRILLQYTQGGGHLTLNPTKLKYWTIAVLLIAYAIGKNIGLYEWIAFRALAEISLSALFRPPIDLKSLAATPGAVTQLFRDGTLLSVGFAVRAAIEAAPITFASSVDINSDQLEVIAQVGLAISISQFPVAVISQRTMSDLIGAPSSVKIKLRSILIATLTAAAIALVMILTGMLLRIVGRDLLISTSPIYIAVTALLIIIKNTISGAGTLFVAAEKYSQSVYLGIGEFVLIITALLFVQQSESLSATKILLTTLATTLLASIAWILIALRSEGGVHLETREPHAESEKYIPTNR